MARGQICKPQIAYKAFKPKPIVIRSPTSSKVIGTLVYVNHKPDKLGIDVMIDFKPVKIFETRHTLLELKIACEQRYSEGQTIWRFSFQCLTSRSIAFVLNEVAKKIATEFARKFPNA